MMRAGAAALWSHWRRASLQLFTLLAGLALATALWSGVQAVNAEARASYDAAAATLGEGRFDQLLPRAGDTIPQARYIALRRAGWQVGPVIEGTLRFDDARVRVVGLDPLTAPGGLGPVTLDGAIGITDFLSDGVIFADAATARLLDGTIAARIVVDPGVAPDTALTDVGVAQRLLGQPGALSRLMVAETQPLGLPPLEDVAPDLVRQPAQGGSDIGRLTDSFHLNLTAFGLLSFAVGLFIVHGTIGLVFEQRRPLIRTLRALGMPLHRVVWLLVLELGIMALLAGALGVVLGYVLAGILLPGVAATLEGLYGAQVAGSLQVRPVWWASGLALSLGGAAMAGAGALWRIARMPVLASAGGRAWAMAAGQGRRLQAAVSAGLLAVAVVTAALGSGLLAGFVVLGAMLIGAAMALPLVLDLALWAANRRARGPVGQWFWADTRQQMPGLSLALMALLLAMAANVGVSTMVSSFRLTFTGFLDQRLSAELYVSVEEASQARALEAFAAPRAREVQPIQWVDTRVRGFPAELYGARIGQTYRDNWRFLQAEPEVWDLVAAEEAAIVNEQLARRAGLSLGDRIAVASVDLPVAGIVGDYGNPIGQVIVAETLFRTAYPAVLPTRFGLRSDDPATLRRALSEDFGLPEASIIDQGAIKRFSLQVFDRTFVVTGALNVLTLAVAGFAILMSLLTLAALRLPQLAPVWALGLTLRQIGGLEVLRTLVLAGMTAVLALPLGLALAWVLLAFVNVEAFGWRLPMFLFPADYARLGGFAALAAVLAVGWPAWRLARTPPADLLKVFAHER